MLKRVCQSFTSLTLLPIAFIALSCSGTKNLSHPPTWTELQELNQDAEGKSVTVMLDDSEILEAREFQAHPDSMEWITDSANVQFHYVIANNRILKVDLKPASVGRRLFSDMVVGTGVGLGLSLMVLLDTGFHPQDGSEVGTVFGVVTGAGFLIGSLVGLIDGLHAHANGEADTYNLNIQVSESNPWLELLLNTMVGNSNPEILERRLVER